MPKHPSVPSAAGGHPQSQVLHRAAIALQMGQFAEAEQLASGVLKANRTDIGAAAILARALIAQNRCGDAIGPLERIMRRDSDPMIEVLLGAALGGAGRRSDAIELLRRTVEHQPPFLPAFQELAGQLSLAGRVDEAIAVIERALALAPSAIELQLALGRLLLSRGDRARARAILTAARAAAPGHPDILGVLARALLLDGDYAAAADLYRQVLALRPDDAMTRADFSACLLEMGQREAGEANLRLALRGRPHMIGRTTHAMIFSSHGRFFFRPSAAAKFLSEPG